MTVNLYQDETHISLRIYGLLGREVAVLVNDQRPPGSYSATWNAAGMASAVYFCRLKVGAAVSVRTMVLAR